MDQSDSFEGLMGRLRDGDQDAAVEVVRRLAARLNGLARAQLDTWVRRKVDPEDVVQSVFRSFFCRYEAGRFDVASWDELWSLLAVIAARKCINRVEYFSAKCRAGEVPAPAWWADDSVGGWPAVAPGPTPLETAVLNEAVEQLLRGLEGDDRAMAELSLQGYTAREISARLGHSERTVGRLRERLKRRLERMQAAEAAGP
jgi:DNA-directed RNA polymerase specialized sigma24 family protein